MSSPSPSQHPRREAGFRADVNIVTFTHDALPLTGDKIEVLQGLNVCRYTGGLESEDSIPATTHGDDVDATAVFVWPAAEPLCNLICERRKKAVCEDHTLNRGHKEEQTANSNTQRQHKNDDNVEESDGDDSQDIFCDVRGKSVVEIGCGPGLPGIVAAKMGADRVVLCDKPSELELPQKNAERNGVGSIVQSLPCYWGDEQTMQALGEFDIVLVSDCLYGHDPEISVLLFKTMKSLCKKTGGKILMSYQLRENLCQDMPFFDLIKDSFHSCKCIAVDDVWIFEWSLLK